VLYSVCGNPSSLLPVRFLLAGWHLRCPAFLWYDEAMSELEMNRLLPWLSIWQEIRWSQDRGYVEHAQLLQRLMDEEFDNDD